MAEEWLVDVHSTLRHLMIEIDEVITLASMSSVPEGRAFSASDLMDMVRRDLEGMADDTMWWIEKKLQVCLKVKVLRVKQRSSKSELSI